MQNSLTETKKSGLSKSMLQLIAVLTMFIDHAWLTGLMWDNATAAAFIVMRFIGRATIVIMCYFVAEGYFKTRSVGKYIIRLGIFAAVSQIPYYLAIHSFTLPTTFNGWAVSMFYDRNVIFNLFLGLCVLTIVMSDYSLWVKLIAAAAALQLAKSSDWSYYVILWIVGVGVFRGSKKKQLLWMAGVVMLRLIMTAIGPVMTIMETSSIKALTLYNWIASFGSFAGVALLALYNGEKGRMPKWTFYIVYPTHLLLIFILNIVLY